MSKRREKEVVPIDEGKQSRVCLRFLEVFARLLQQLVEFVVY